MYLHGIVYPLYPFSVFSNNIIYKTTNLIPWQCSDNILHSVDNHFTATATLSTIIVKCTTAQSNLSIHQTNYYTTTYRNTTTRGDTQSTIMWIGWTTAIPCPIWPTLSLASSQDTNISPNGTVLCPIPKPMQINRTQRYHSRTIIIIIPSPIDNFNSPQAHATSISQAQQ